MQSYFHIFSAFLAYFKVYNSLSVLSANYIKIILEWSMKGQISDALVSLCHPRAFSKNSREVFN